MVSKAHMYELMTINLIHIYLRELFKITEFFLVAKY
jgi:hypothetical protein